MSKLLQHHDLNFGQIIKHINKSIFISSAIPEKYDHYIEGIIQLFKDKSISETVEFVCGLYKVNDIGTETICLKFTDKYLKSYCLNLFTETFIYDDKQLIISTDSNSEIEIKIVIHKDNFRKIHVVYHKDCMDGLAAASLFERINEVNGGNQFKIIYHPLQYGKNTNFTEGEETDIVIFVDFSLSPELLDVIAQRVKVLCIIDHHKTATEGIFNLVHKYKDSTVKTVKYIYDVEECGASLTKKALNSYLKLDNGYMDTFFSYIRDRDLWLFELPESKEFHEGLVYLTHDYKNSPVEFDTFIKDICKEMDSNIFKIRDELLHIGRINTVQVDRKVNKICKKLKYVDNFKFKDVEFKLLNLTDNMSEVGNGICTQLNTPAMMYFVVDNKKVVFGLRSLDTLPDVSVIAKSMGGGGHRNACGFEIEIKELNKLLGHDLCSRVRKSIKTKCEVFKNLFRKNNESK